MEFSIKDTLTLKDLLMSVYCQNDADKETIDWLCFACNVAKKVSEHFNNTNNKVEFYRSILSDKSLKGTEGYKCLYKHYHYLLDNEEV